MTWLGNKKLWMRTAITQGKILKEEFCNEDQMRRYSRKNKYHGKYGKLSRKVKKSKRNIIIKIKWIWGKVIHMKVKETLNIQIIGDTEKAVKIE